MDAYSDREMKWAQAFILIVTIVCKQDRLVHECNDDYIYFSS